MIRIEVILGYQEVLEVVKNGVQEKDDAATKKKDCKARCLLHQCVDMVNFEKISKARTTKEAWEILQNAYASVERTKMVKLQSFRRQYELLSMADQETVTEYFNKLQLLVNSMRNCGETITDHKMVEKVLRTVSSKFDYVVVAIEECKDIGQLKIEELQGTLEAHELKMVNKIAEKAKEEQVVQAQMSNMGHSSRGR